MFGGFRENDSFFSKSFCPQNVSPLLLINGLVMGTNELRSNLASFVHTLNI